MPPKLNTDDFDEKMTGLMTQIINDQAFDVRQLRSVAALGKRWRMRHHVDEHLMTCADHITACHDVVKYLIDEIAKTQDEIYLKKTIISDLMHKNQIQATKVKALRQLLDDRTKELHQLSIRSLVFFKIRQFFLKK